MSLAGRGSRIVFWFAGLAAAVAVCAAWASGPALAAGEDKPAAKQSAEAKKPAAPAHRVVACYFHRTVRCPTCKKISAYIEESVTETFAAQQKDGSVKVVMIDFQDPKNKQYTESYKITGPTLVVMDVRNDKVTAWKPAPRVWALVGDKKGFFKYVEEEVRSYLEPKKP